MNSLKYINDMKDYKASILNEIAKIQESKTDYETEKYEMYKSVHLDRIEDALKEIDKIQNNIDTYIDSKHKLIRDKYFQELNITRLVYRIIKAYGRISFTGIIRFADCELCLQLTENEVKQALKELFKVKYIEKVVINVEDQKIRASICTGTIHYDVNCYRAIK